MIWTPLVNTHLSSGEPSEGDGPDDTVKALVETLFAAGPAGIAFIDNSLLSVGPNSVLAIERYSFNSTTHEGTFESSLRKGTLAVVSGKIAKQSPEAMRVKIPSSILGVRGTEFLVRAGD